MCSFGARNWWRLAVTAFNLANRSSFVTVPPSETVKHQQFINMDIRRLCSTSLYPSAARHPCTSNCMNVVVVKRASIILHECAHRQHIACRTNSIVFCQWCDGLIRPLPPPPPKKKNDDVHFHASKKKNDCTVRSRC